jgi:hypothetical protein
MGLAAQAKPQYQLAFHVVVALFCRESTDESLHENAKSSAIRKCPPLDIVPTPTLARVAFAPAPDRAHPVQSNWKKTCATRSKNRARQSGGGARSPFEHDPKHPA